MTDLTEQEKIWNELSNTDKAWFRCVDCGLTKGRTNQVFCSVKGEVVPRGLVLIGEAPGADEDECGVAFVGRAGKKLDRLLTEAGIENIFITNTVLCRPPNNRNPKMIEMRKCWPRLQRQLLALKPRAIICAGKIAANFILDNDKSMGGMIDRVYPWSLGGRFNATVVPIYHPSYLLRQRNASVDKRMIDRLKLASNVSEEG